MSSEESLKKIEELIKRVEELEKHKCPIWPIPNTPIYPNFPVYPNTYPNLHYHGFTPCYNNPCYWNGNTFY